MSRLNSFLFAMFFILLLGTVQVAAGETYTESGTIYDNADGYWDDTEYKMYKYVVKPDETFQIQVTVTGGDLYVFYMEGYDYSDIEDIVYDLMLYGDSQDLYFAFSTVGGYGEFTFTTTERIAAKIAVFSYDDYYIPVNMQYSIETNIPSGSRISILLYGAIIIGVIVLVGYGFSRNKKSSKSTYNPPTYGYQSYRNSLNYQQSYQQPQQQNYTSSTQSSSGTSESPTKYCYNCGNRSTDLNKYCTTCGSQL